MPFFGWFFAWFRNDSSYDYYEIPVDEILDDYVCDEYDDCE